MTSSHLMLRSRPSEDCTYHRRTRWIPVGLKIASILAYVLFFSWFSISRHNRFWTGGYDLGDFYCAVWNTIRGRILRLSNLPGPDSRLSVTLAKPFAGTVALSQKR